MKFLPYDRFTIRTALAPQDVFARLEHNVQRAYLNGPHLAFQGRIGEDAFRISHIITYRNSFLPIILGTVRRSGSDSVIAMTLRPSWFVVAFMVAWFGGVGVASLLIARAWLDGRLLVPPASAAAVPLLMLFFGAVVVNGCFWYEAVRAKETLAGLFRAD